MRIPTSVLGVDSPWNELPCTAPLAVWTSHVARACGRMAMTECDGLCVTSSDIGVPVWDDELREIAVAYPHPGCPRHAPDQVCDCDTPERCLSPTHGLIEMDEALMIRHGQRGER